MKRRKEMNFGEVKTITDDCYLTKTAKDRALEQVDLRAVKTVKEYIEKSGKIKRYVIIMRNGNYIERFEPLRIYRLIKEETP